MTKTRATQADACGRTLIALTLVMLFAASSIAGPYTEKGIAGYVDPVSRQPVSPNDPNAVVNPIFRSWAEAVHEYAPSDDEWISPECPVNDPASALGPATGQTCDVVSLGELDLDEIARGDLPGSITLVFGDPCAVDDPARIRNGKGYDFAVFENGLISEHSTGAGSVRGKMFAELGFVEVSSNGIDFVRFPSVSLTPAAVGRYGTIEVSDVYNLAGKHANGRGKCTGTPFDLEELAAHPDVVSQLVDINDIRYVRIVDVPGSGDFADAASEHIDPNTWPAWQPYGEEHPIYDAWPTVGRGGADVEALGVLYEQEYSADINLDGIVDAADLALLASAWGSRFGQSEWIGRCDLAAPRGLQINAADLAEFSSQWLCVETWRTEYEQ